MVAVVGSVDRFDYRQSADLIQLFPRRLQPGAGESLLDAICRLCA